MWYNNVEQKSIDMYNKARETACRAVVDANEFEHLTASKFSEDPEGMTSEQKHEETKQAVARFEKLIDRIETVDPAFALEMRNNAGAFASMFDRARAALKRDENVEERN